MTTCVFCSRGIKREISLQFIYSFQAFKVPLACSKCLNSFQAIEKNNACPGCSRLQEGQSICTDCEKWLKYAPEVKPNHVALFEYNDKSQKYMNQFKFQGDVKLAAVFGEELHQKLKPYTKTHRITTIPSSTTSFQERGFNAVDLLLNYANIPHQPLLKHVGTAQKQSSKTRSERLLSVQPFALISQEELEASARPILVVDDVYTTGRTIFHARLLLEKAIPSSSLSLFR